LKEFIKSEFIKNVPISKIDLKNLWEMIVGNNQSDLDSTIYITVDMLKIEEKSIEALLAHKEIPDRLSGYEIRSYNRDSKYKSAIDLTTNTGASSHLYITGYDEAWVRGKFQQIEEFINSKFDKFNKEQKLAEKIDVSAKKEKDNKTEIPTTLMRLGKNSEISKVAQIGIMEKVLNRIFVVHGHDDEMKLAVARTLEKLDLTPIILHEQPDGNKTIIEKFEQYSDVCFAIIILSPDDFAYPKNIDPSKGKYRARQNVIMELGFFLAKLGREKVFILCRIDDNFEMASDYSGILYTPYDNAGYWKYKMADEMRHVDPTIDKNKL